MKIDITQVIKDKLEELKKSLDAQKVIQQEMVAMHAWMVAEIFERRILTLSIKIELLEEILRIHESSEG